MNNKDYFIKNIYLKVAKRDDSSDNLVGIRITKSEGTEKLTVIFPIGYSLGKIDEEIEYKEDYNNDIKSLIQCLSMKLDNAEMNKKNNFSFISAIQLIQDYGKIGLYKEDYTYIY